MKIVKYNQETGEFIAQEDIQMIEERLFGLSIVISPINYLILIDVDTVIKDSTFLEAVRKQYPDPSSVYVATEANIDDLVAMMRERPERFLGKPIELKPSPPMPDVDYSDYKQKPGQWYDRYYKPNKNRNRR